MQGFSHLPVGLLARVYALVDQTYGQEGVALQLGIKDRLRGRAVCRHWRWALGELPLPALRLLKGVSETLLREQLAWMVNSKPCVQALALEGVTDESVKSRKLTKALGALGPQDLVELELKAGSPLAMLLPLPAPFPRLRALRLELAAPADLAAAQAALPALGPQLPRLRRLVVAQLNYCSPGAKYYVPGGLTLPPGFPRLTALELKGLDEAEVDLALVPCLETLTVAAWEVQLVWGGAAAAGSAAAASPGACAGRGGVQHNCPLRELAIDARDRRRGEWAWETGRASLAEVPGLPALESLALENLEKVDGAEAALCPATRLTRLRLSRCTPAVVRQLLFDILPEKAPIALEFRPAINPSPHLHEQLPFPAATLPRLTALTVSPSVDAAWLAGLTALGHLRRLELTEDSGIYRPIAIPSVASLTEVVVSLKYCQGVTVDLALLPCLERLTINSPGSPVTLRRSPARLAPAGAAHCRARDSRLAVVAIHGSIVTLDFNHLPALATLELESGQALRVPPGLGPAARGACCLALSTQKPKCGFVDSLLRRAPPTLAGLALSGASWEKLGAGEPALGALRALDLHPAVVPTAIVTKEAQEAAAAAQQAALAALLAGGSPLWAQLEALALPLPLPQGLRGAPRLRRLLIRGVVDPAVLDRDLPLLQSLPALDHLQFEKGLSSGEALEALHAALPRLRQPAAPAVPPEWERCGVAFLEAALGPDER